MPNPIKINPDKELKFITDGDTVAGWHFRKFLIEYKEYDAVQKQIIKEKNIQISELQSQLKYALEKIPDEPDCLKMKILAQRKELARINQELKEKNKQIERLEKEIKRYKDTMAGNEEI